MLQSPSDKTAFRLGAASIGLFAGTALGVVLWWFLARFGMGAHAIASFIFGGLVSGAITGAAFPEAGMSLANATLHFFIGIFATEIVINGGDFENVSKPGLPASTWLAVAFTFGVIYALTLWLFA